MSILGTLDNDTVWQILSIVRYSRFLPEHTIRIDTDMI
jgi:hypothetical protein